MDEHMYAITVDSLDDSLEHHGVKGQKWGVRRTPQQLGYKSAGKNDDTPDFANRNSESFQAHQAKMMSKAHDLVREQFKGAELEKAIDREYRFNKAYNEYYWGDPDDKEFGQVKKEYESFYDDPGFNKIRKNTTDFIKNNASSNLRKEMNGHEEDYTLMGRLANKDHENGNRALTNEYELLQFAYEEAYTELVVPPALERYRKDPDYVEHSDLYFEDELYHHGTKGMRWGIRRYQNKDGSLTPAGRKHRSLGQVIKDHKTAKKRKAALEKARETKAKKKIEEEKAKKAAEKRAKDIAAGKISPKKMTDAELAAAMKRLDDEKKYKEKLIESSKGRQFMEKMWKDAILPGVSEGGKEAIKSAVSKYGKDLLGVDKKTIDKAQQEYDRLKRQDEMTKFRKNTLANEQQIAYLQREKAAGFPNEKKGKEKSDKEKKAEAQKQVDEYNAKREEEIREQARRQRQPSDDEGEYSYKRPLKVPAVVSNKPLADAGSSSAVKKGEQFIQDPETGRWLDVTELD